MAGVFLIVSSVVYMFQCYASSGRSPSRRRSGGCAATAVRLGAIAASSPAGAAAPSGPNNLFVDPGQGPLISRCDACGRYNRIPAGSTADSLLAPCLTFARKNKFLEKYMSLNGYN